MERKLDILPRFLKTVLRNDTGFSLAEIMVAAGVAGTLALGTLQLASLHTKSTMTDELISAQQTAQLKLRNSTACTNTVQGLNVSAYSPYDGSVDPAPVNIPNGIRNNDGSVSIPISPSAANITVANENLIDKSSNYVVFGTSVMVKSMTMTDVRTTGGNNKTVRDTTSDLKLAAVGEIRIEFAAKYSANSAGNKIKIVTKHVLVPLTLSSAGIIEDCTTPEDIGVQETEEELCADFGGSFVSGRCEGAEEAMTDSTKLKLCTDIKGSYSVTTNSCIPPWVGCQCPGSFMSGFDTTTGKPLCNSGSPVGCLVP